MNALIVFLTVSLALAGSGMTGMNSSSQVEMDVPIAVEEAAETEEGEYVFTNAVVDVDAWRAEFESMWNADHDEKVIFESYATEDDDPYPTLLTAVIGEAIYMELYYATNSETYWFISSIYEDYTPVRKIKEYEEYFYASVMTALLSQFEEITISEVRDMDAEMRKLVEGLQAGTISEDDAYFYYGDAYICFEKDADAGSIDCFIGM